MSSEFSTAKSAYPTQDLEDILAAYGQSPRETFLVATDGEDVVGTVAIKQDDNPQWALLRRLFVSPQHRGKGIGGKLVHAAISFCRQHGYRHLRFRTTMQMARAIRLCEKAGFQVKDRLYWGPMELLIYELHLSPAQSEK